jgi:hypothetical protein
MSKKISAARAAAFLKAVQETGHQTLAAERAKVSRSWVLVHRKREPGFEAAVQKACLARTAGAGRGQAAARVGASGRG